MNKQKVNREIYLDSAASTLPDADIMEEVKRVSVEFYGNPSSIHREGQKAKMLLEESRERVSKLLDCERSEILFTSSASESNSMVLSYPHKKILISSVSHPSVFRFKDRDNVGIIPVDKNGIVDMQFIDNVLTKEKIDLISILYVNNETGIIQPLEDIIELVNGRALIHVDATQSISYLPIPKGIDYLSCSSHKFYGPKGVGILYLKKDRPIKKFIIGDDNERNKRGGSENVPGIFGASIALERAILNMEQNNIKNVKIQKYFEDTLKKDLDIEIIGKSSKRVGNISNISFKGIKNDLLLFKLDMNGIYASAGSACSSGSIENSHVLTSMSKSDITIKGSIRFSFGKQNTIEEVDYVCIKIKEIIKEILNE